MAKISIDNEGLDYLKNTDTRKIVYEGEYNGDTFCDDLPISHNGHISLDKNILSKEPCSLISEQINSAINEFVRGYLSVSFNGEFFINRSWVLRHDENHWAQPHTHPNSVLSGVLYLEVPQESGHIKFHKPSNYHNHINTDTFRFVIEEYGTHNCENWKIIPENGDLLLFPSHLSHSIGLNTSGKTRWSVGFDCFIDGILDAHDSRRLYVGGSKDFHIMTSG